MVKYITLGEKNKEIVLEKLTLISELRTKAFRLLHSVVFEKRLDSNLIPSLEDYISEVIDLYKFLRPKIKRMDNSDYKELFEIDNYELILSKLSFNDYTKLFSLYNIFSHFENLLREICEDLGYTIDKPVETLKV